KNINTTPINFNIINIIKKPNYNNNIKPIKYTINIHQQPISNSLLSFNKQKNNNNHTNTT
ncbi:hypothetical protein GH890_31805, partial [Bacillus thuringiensis]|nr:hypothetical protein [Bacillus thuringiensis]